MSFNSFSFLPVVTFTPSTFLPDSFSPSPLQAINAVELKNKPNVRLKTVFNFLIIFLFFLLDDTIIIECPFTHIVSSVTFLQNRI